MANQTGIAITIRAFLQTGKTLNEQFEALSIVKTAHETGDYSALLKAATVEDVKTEQKTRRIEDQPQDGEKAGQTESEKSDGQAGGGEGPTTEQKEQAAAEADVKHFHVDDAKPAADADVPEFLKKEKKSKAA